MRTNAVGRVATQLQKRCEVCASPALGVVWGLRLCDRHAWMANAVMPSGVLTGVAWTVALCALVQHLREWSRR
jgi:hypothetical protein